MSLRSFARGVGVSPSLISQIERGKVSPSVATLYAMTSQLEISLDDVFVGEKADDSSRGYEEKVLPSQWEAPQEGPVVRGGNRLTLTRATGVKWERLTASHDPNVEFLHCTYPVGGESCPADELMTHSGSEYGIVLQGRLGATVGDEDYVLEASDSLAFDSTAPHRIWTVGDEPSTAIWVVVGREGDPRVPPR